MLPLQLKAPVNALNAVQLGGRGDYFRNLLTLNGVNAFGELGWSTTSCNWSFDVVLMPDTLVGDRAIIDTSNLAGKGNVLFYFDDPDGLQFIFVREDGAFNRHILGNAGVSIDGISKISLSVSDNTATINVNGVIHNVIDNALLNVSRFKLESLFGGGGRNFSGQVLRAKITDIDNPINSLKAFEFVGGRPDYELGKGAALGAELADISNGVLRTAAASISNGTVTVLGNTTAYNSDYTLEIPVDSNTLYKIGVTQSGSSPYVDLREFEGSVSLGQRNLGFVVTKSTASSIKLKFSRAIAGAGAASFSGVTVTKFPKSILLWKNFDILLGDWQKAKITDTGLIGEDIIEQNGRTVWNGSESDWATKVLANNVTEKDFEVVLDLTRGESGLLKIESNAGAGVFMRAGKKYTFEKKLSDWPYLQNNGGANKFLGEALVNIRPTFTYIEPV